MQAGLEVIERRADLAQLEIRALVSRSLTSLALSLLAVVLLLCAWVAAMGAAYLGLRHPIGPLGALAGVAGVNLILGIAATLSAQRFSRGLRQ